MKWKRQEEPRVWSRDGGLVSRELLLVRPQQIGAPGKCMDGAEKEKRPKEEPWGPWMGEDREKEEDLETRVWQEGVWCGEH